MDDDEISSTISTELDQQEDEQLKSTLLKRVTSIKNKLTDTFSRLTTTTTTNPLSENYSQDLTHLDQFQFPPRLFSKVNSRVLRTPSLSSKIFVGCFFLFNRDFRMMKQ